MASNFCCDYWWRRGSTFTSHCYGLGSTPTMGHMWDVFHPSQPMPGGFPLWVFFHPQKDLRLFHLEPSHKANWAWPELVLGDVKSMALPFYPFSACLLTAYSPYICPYVVGMSAPAHQYARLGCRGGDGAHQGGAVTQIRAAAYSTTGEYRHFYFLAFTQIS